MLPSVGGILRYSLECVEGFFTEVHTTYLGL